MPIGRIGDRLAKRVEALEENNACGYLKTLVTGSSTLRIPVTLSYIGVASLIKGLSTKGISLRFTGSIMVDLITLPLNFEYNI